MAEDFIRSDLWTNTLGVGYLTWLRHTSANFAIEYKPGYFYAYTAGIIPTSLSAGATYEGIGISKQCRPTFVPKSERNLRRSNQWVRIPDKACGHFVLHIRGQGNCIECERTKDNVWQVKTAFVTGKPLPSLFAQWFEHLYQ